MTPNQSHFAIATRRPVAIFMVVLAVCVFGAVSYKKLALTLMPDISYPTITVRTEYPGTAPQEVELQVSNRLEQELGILANLSSIKSISQAGQSDVILQFAWGTDVSASAQDIREKLDRVRLPNGADRPLILRYDPSLDPIMRLGLTGDLPLKQLRVMAEDVVQRGLEGEPGIAAVKVKGGLEDEYQVLIDERKLTPLNLDIQQINTRLSQNNVNLPGGQLREGKTLYVIRTLNELQSIADIESIVVARKNGVDIQLRDIARVISSHKEKEVETRVSGRESVEIEIYKEADANIVSVANNVLEKLFGTEAQRAYVRDWRPPTIEEEQARINAYATQKTSDLRRDHIMEERRHQEMTSFIAFNLPEGSGIQVLTNQSIFIKQSIDEVVNSALLGGLIATLVLFLFLRNLGHTLIIGITIPVSIVATFGAMYLFDVSLNIISLGGLALGVGMLVDNSIVVLESIFRCREEGDGFVASTVRGVSEVGGAVIASTLTTIAVFFPIVFTEGVAAQVFGDMSLTVVFSLLASLAVSLYLIPMLGSRRFGRAEESEAAAEPVARASIGSRLAGPFRSMAESFRGYRTALKPRGVFLRILGYAVLPIVLAYLATVAIAAFALALAGGLIEIVFTILLRVAKLLWGILGFGLRLVEPFLEAFNRAFLKLADGYSRFLDWALNHKGIIVGGAILSFLASVNFIFPQLGRELIPQVRQGEFNLNVALPIGTPLERTAEVIARIEQIIIEEPEVARTAVVAGTDRSASTKAEEGEHSGKITVRMRDGMNRLDEAAVIERIRRAVSLIPEIEVEVSYPELFSLQAPIEVEINGFDLDQLKSLSTRAEAAIQAIPGIVDVQSTAQRGNPEVQIRYDRQKLARLDLQMRSVAELVRNKIQGEVPTEFRDRDRQVDILVRLEEKDRLGVEELKRIVVNPRGQAPIPLEAVADLSVREGPNEIRHIAMQRSAVISANVDGIDLDTATLLINEALIDLELPTGFSFQIKGQAEEMNRSLNSLLFALALALFLVYIVMASQFESLLHPFIILFTVPLAIIGVLVVLLVGGWSLNILVFIGLIMLAGIVVNNAIVLVDCINMLRRQGREKIDAVKSACQARLRPILMTTMTTVLGLIPMAIGLGEGSEIRVPLAVTVISGLTSSTFLTLVVIPAVYLLFDFSKIEVEQELAAEREEVIV